MNKPLPLHLAVLSSLCLAAALTTTPVLAASDAAFEGAWQQFNNAGDDAQAITRAADAFEALRAAEPANPVLLAYAGASLARQAATTWLPWKKIAYAEDGLAAIDKALALLGAAHDAPMQHGTPGSLEVKLVAANTFLAVPGFMNRGARGARLLEEVLGSPLLAQSPLPFRATVWLRAARKAQDDQRPADARRWLEEVVRSGAPQAPAARARLAEMPA